MKPPNFLTVTPAAAAVDGRASEESGLKMSLIEENNTPKLPNAHLLHASE